MTNILLFILMASLWIYGLILLKKLKMYFFYFLVGCVGLFTLVMIFYLQPLQIMMLKYQAYVLLFLEKVLGLYTVSFKELVVMIDTKTGFVTMILNYECSAIIEMLVYTCLILFFPFTNIREKVIKSIWGNIYIFLCNTLRLLFIMVMVKVLGIEYYRMIHTVLARILFFVFMVILYYLVFTKEQLVKQKVGEMGL